jgi:glycerol-3-phosphate acyltransferase PlsY
VSYIFAGLFGYLCGSVPFGVLAGWFAGIDVRQHGSGNIGATNVLRVVGKPYGVAVFIADALKGFVAVAAALKAAQAGLGDPSLMGIVAGVSAVAGHAFPCWLKFRGGKGVATSAGVCAALFPAALAIGAAVWLAIFFAFGFVSLASIAAAVALPLSLWIMSSFSPAVGETLIVFSCVIALLVIVRHRSNLVRLARGTEPRFGRK